MVRLDKQLGKVQQHFVLLRVTNMRGINLRQFDFDYDLTWMAFVLTPDGDVLHRFGGRGRNEPDMYRNVAALQYTLARARKRYEHQPVSVQKSKARPFSVEQYTSARYLSRRACIHCHQVHDFRRQDGLANKTWTRDQEWLYPYPENVGLTMDKTRGNEIASLTKKSPAANAGLRANDRLRTVNKIPVASFADVQYALHKAPPTGSIPVTWQRGDRSHTGQMKLSLGWRNTDLSWRWSLRTRKPHPSLQGDDLTAAEKRQLGLNPNQLAFRQGPFVREAARHAGIQTNDIIVGVDGKTLHVTMHQFQAHIRLYYQPGQWITVNLLRQGKRLDKKLQLPR